MRFLCVILLGFFLLSCDNPVAVQDSGTQTVDDVNAVASFNARGKRREQLFSAAQEKGIELWINDDGSIGHYLADGKAIDDILTWIRAVNWVNN